MLKTILLVGLGGAFGSMARYAISIVHNKYFQPTSYIPTLISNIIGCFIIGVLMGYFQKQGNETSMLKFLLVTGFCGGFTTFSSFAFENITLLQNGNLNQAILYIGISLLFCLLAVWIGMLIHN